MEKDIVKIVKPHIEQILKDNNLNLYDLEYVYEDKTWILRVRNMDYTEIQDMELYSSLYHW